MNVPTSDSDPTGLAALVAVLVSAVLAAVGVAADVAGLWVAVAVAAVNLGAFIWARRKAWAPASVDRVIDNTTDTVRALTLADINSLKPKRKPARKKVS